MWKVVLIWLMLGSLLCVFMHDYPSIHPCIFFFSSAYPKQGHQDFALPRHFLSSFRRIHRRSEASDTTCTDGHHYAQTWCLLWTHYNWNRSSTTKHHLGSNQGGRSSQSHPSREHCRWPHECRSLPGRWWESPVGAPSITPPTASKKAVYSALLYGPLRWNNSKRPFSEQKA